MKKIAITALAAVMATVGMASAAAADSRRGDNEWRHKDRHVERHVDRRHVRHHKWKRHHWRHGHRHGPRVVIRGNFRDDVCFIKKVRRYDDWGNMYIKRVRICR